MCAVFCDLKNKWQRELKKTEKWYGLVVFIFGVLSALLFSFAIKEKELYALSEYLEFAMEMKLTMSGIVLAKAKDVLILVLFGYTDMKKIWNYLFLAGMGFAYGLQLILQVVHYKLYGGILFLLMHFPQDLVWVPMLIIAMRFDGRGRERKYFLKKIAFLLTICTIGGWLQTMFGTKMYAFVTKML